MRTKFNILLCLVCAIAVTACQTVTIRDKGIRKISSEPTYEDSRAFYLGGLVGEHRIDTLKICKGKPATQMQTQRTFLDGFLTVITLLIYAPHTVKVWCPDSNNVARGN